MLYSKECEIMWHSVKRNHAILLDRMLCPFSKTNIVVSLSFRWWRSTDLDNSLLYANAKSRVAYNDAVAPDIAESRSQVNRVVLSSRDERPKFADRLNHRRNCLEKKKNEWGKAKS